MCRLRASRQDAEAHAMTWISASGSIAAIWRTMSDGKLCQPAWALVKPKAHLNLEHSLLGGHDANAICRWHTLKESGFQSFKAVWVRVCRAQLWRATVLHQHHCPVIHQLWYIQNKSSAMI